MKRLERHLRRLEEVSRRKRRMCTEDFMRMRLLELQQEAGQKFSKEEQSDLKRLHELEVPLAANEAMNPRGLIWPQAYLSESSGRKNRLLP